jgi:hypothetical protein
VTPDGTIRTLAGNGTAGFGGDRGPAAAAARNNPPRVAVDAGGNVFIGDTNNNRIRVVATAAPKHPADTIGMYDNTGFNPNGTAWYLRSANSGGYPDAGAGFVFGGVHWKGVVGD